MKRSRRELSIDVVIHQGIFKNNEITLFPCFALFTPKTGASFYCAYLIAKMSGAIGEHDTKQATECNPQVQFYSFKLVRLR